MKEWGLFGRKKPGEQLKKSMREVKDSIRVADREFNDLKKEEVRLTEDIRQAARSGNEQATRILALQLVRLREHISRMQLQNAALRGVGTSMTAASSNATLTASMQQATKAMATVAVDPAKVQKDMAEFVKADARQGEALSFLDNSMEAAFDTGQMQDEADELMDQLFDEIGLETAAQVAAQPAAVRPLPAAAVPQTEQAVEAESDDKLMQMLAALKL